MATRERVSDMITAFCGVYRNSETKENLIDTYTMALNEYTDAEITKAGNNCFDFCEFFPKPIDITKQIKELRAKKIEKSSYTKEEEFKISPGIRCRKCENIRTCIKDPVNTGVWTCRECYTGLTNKQYTEKIRGIISQLKEA